VLVAGVAVGYTLHKPKVFQATAAIAIIQPEQNQALGAVATASPSTYLDSQVVLLESNEVAQQAAVLGNASLHRQVFKASDFSGPHDFVTITPQTTTDLNSPVVDVTFEAKDAAAAQAGADALVLGYNAVLSERIKATVSSAIAVMGESLNSVDAQLASLTAQSSPLDTQLAASLITQRSDLLNQQSQALIDESVALSDKAPMTLAFLPHKAANRSLGKVGGLGAVIGFLMGVCLAFVVETRRTRVKVASSVQVRLEGTSSSRPQAGVVARAAVRERGAAPRERPISKQRAT